MPQSKFAQVRYHAGRVALAIVLALLCVSSMAIAEDDIPGDSETVLMMLMSGPTVLHTIEMPSMDRCRKAVEFTSSARCVVVHKAISQANRSHPARPVISLTK